MFWVELLLVYYEWCQLKKKKNHLLEDGMNQIKTNFIPGINCHQIRSEYSTTASECTVKCNDTQSKYVRRTKDSYPMI